MKKYVAFLLVLTLICDSWSIPKPMESIENYNVMLIHGAYGKEKGFLDISDSTKIKEAYAATKALDNGAALGRYYEEPDDKPRLLHWLTTKVFEEPEMDSEDAHPKYSYVYQWRSFSNPANSSYNNAFELGSRTWYMPATKYEHRRAMMEEAQEVKAVITQEITNDSGVKIDTIAKGQSALELIRKNPDLYRQLASRYILIGHSMGGVVSREYVQGDFYNGDVDKIITLDSPHEGTGALNMQVSKEARNFVGEKLAVDYLQSVIAASVVGIPLLFVNNTFAVQCGLTIMGLSFALQAISVPITRAASPEVYFEDDPLVHYVDPLQKGYGTIDSLNNLDYRDNVPGLPMFRILASENGMTFTDPNQLDYGVLDYLRHLLPNNFTLPFANAAKQLSGPGDVSAVFANTLTSALAGFAGIPIQENGSSIVPAYSSEARHVDLLNDSDVNTKRAWFNAAPNVSGSLGDAALALQVTSGTILAIDLLGYVISPAAADAAKLGVAASYSAFAAVSFGEAIAAGVMDLFESHQIPLYAKNLRKMAVDANNITSLNDSSSSYTPYLMEDFLYERPFVNLAMLDLHTLDTIQNAGVRAESRFGFILDSLGKLPDSLKKDVDTLLIQGSLLEAERKSVASLNRNCYYLGSDNSVNCAVGLFYKADDLTSAIQKPVSALSELKFKSESDWSKMGVKVDRWEKVDGLHPDGSENKKGVPIRHVERYEVPAITVEDWIEKYSFVVDDLMPHRLRQIRMNFNYQEEIAWECDITKAEDDDKACKVYQRSAGEPWGEPKKTVRHPVKKNGLFDFNPRDYGYDNLFAIQKDNQNTVTISTVNKIGLSNTQRFYSIA